MFFVLFSVKPFIFITTIDIQKQIENINATFVSRCQNLVTKSKKFISASGEPTMDFVFL